MKDLKAAILEPREVALYARMDSHTWYTVFEMHYSDHDEHYTKLPDGERREVPIEGYVRITEPVAMRFTAIDNDTIVRNAVESLNAEERKAIVELNKKIADIRERKNQLLALTHSPATEEI